MPCTEFKLLTFAPLPGEVMWIVGGVSSTLKKMLFTPLCAAETLPALSRVAALNEYRPRRRLPAAAVGNAPLYVHTPLPFTPTEICAADEVQVVPSQYWPVFTW